MKTSILSKISVFSLAFLLLIPNGFSWLHIAHYSMGRDLGYDHNAAGQFNLPDAWPSGLIGVNDWFTWTHAVQRRGTVWFVPRTPSYPDDNRYPGPIMVELAKNKIHWTQTSEKQAALATGRGFYGHNAMDYGVHYGYFKAGTLSNWYTHHYRKEQWADYVVLMVKGGGFFDTDGRSKMFFGQRIDHSNRQQVLLPLTIEPRVTQLAQLVARKNRRMMDVNPANGDESGPWARVERLRTIRSRVSTYRRKMTEEVKGMTEAEYKEWLLEANNNNWNPSVLQIMYIGSVSSARAWIQRL